MAIRQCGLKKWYLVNMTIYIEYYTKTKCVYEKLPFVADGRKHE